MSVKIVTDSTSYLPEEYINEYDISVVSLNVLLNGKSYREVELTNEIFYREMSDSSEIPTSSQPSVEEILKCFKDIAKSGNDIVGVFISSKMSGTYSTAHLVKEMVLEEYPERKIEIIDSTTNCMEMGYQVLQGARAAKEGKDIKEVVSIINETINCSRFLFTPETLKYLKKGGRIGGASALFGTILKINPILTVENGVTTVFDKVRTKKKAIEVMVNKVMLDLREKGIEEVIVHHINCIEEGRVLANLLKEKLNLDVKVQSIGPIIGLHVGPGSIGIAYYTKK
ncbi:MAG: DegV family protein [Clostridiales bacterium]|nr:DegV family protein [Clostridiales bacterium]